MYFREQLTLKKFLKGGNMHNTNNSETIDNEITSMGALMTKAATAWNRIAVNQFTTSQVHGSKFWFSKPQ